ncbi:glycosyl hydrolase [Jiulongibacter sediminis]|jgi:hypothetical protein|uniref:glycosyl hydrolase n=1 Tax=Jiulongibacter sediminis TaxID=1605367 RepID=UPI0026F1D662|nr:glycosyl hydrolase [Jiulongibacter sediminis]
MRLKFLLYGLFLVASKIGFAQKSTQISSKPFTRWWWMGNAITKEGVKYNLEEFHKAGLGGVEITPIYGVKGLEDNFLPFLSPEYLEVLDYTTKVADSLGMAVDMVLGTGWPYGGPQVEPEFAASKLTYTIHEISKGDVIDFSFEKPSPDAVLQCILVKDASGKTEDITADLQKKQAQWLSKVDGKIYVIYCGQTGQKVKRAAPGGEGYTVDHYSNAALQDYLKPFDEHLTAPVRAIFNDSYEVYETDFTPNFLKEFEKRRGYDLKPFLPSLIEKEDSEIANRVRSDYRETLSDLLKEDFNRPWTAWANAKGYQTKLQAHGSPGNLLDMYASADIPECETFGSMPFDIPGLRREAEDIRQGDADPVMLKFSSSAGHVMGKPLISSESFTWLRDHFKTAVSQCKPELEELLLNGVNHVFLHGSTYSPPEAEWPGWKFYASVNFSPQMTIWKEAPALFSYIENCQEYLRKGLPDNEIGVYWPIYDTYSQYLKGQLFFQFKIHSLDEWLLHTPFYKTSKSLMNVGYSVDFFSDEFIEKAKVENGILMLPGGSYKALIIPETEHMPLRTLQKLISLKKDGAQIYFESLPATVPGLHKLSEREETLRKLKTELSSQPFGEILNSLQSQNIDPETLVKSGLKFIRRQNGNQKIYYIVNHTAEDFDNWIDLQTPAENIMLFDPNTGEKGLAKAESDRVYLQLKAGDAIILETQTKDTLQPWAYTEVSNEAFELEGPFQLTFLEGGPRLPQNEKLTELRSWTELNQDAENFSGTAVYSVKFNRPTKAKKWLLQLPDVRESARIRLNGTEIGTLWANPFEIQLPELKKKNNLLEIEVTNLAANRIKAKEMRGEEWKIFYEINMVNKDYQKFDATLWKPMPSGLIGDIKLIPLQEKSL